MQTLENNRQTVEEVLQALLFWGIEEVICCPGGRAAPLIEALFSSGHFRVYSFFEERSAAFFALGRAKRRQMPVAVVTTSGTAAAELLPACIEAFYTQIPLCLVTTDRPERFRGSGAPQAIEQKGLFGLYAPCSFDLPQEILKKSAWDRKTPCHINLCLEEQYEFEKPVWRHPQVLFTAEPKKEEKPLTEEVLERLSSYKRPLVFVGEISKELRTALTSLLKAWKLPVFIDPTSGLLSDPDLSPFCQLDKRNFFSYAEKNGYLIDAVIRFGGTPLPRSWRDIEYSSLPVYSFHNAPFPGLSNRQNPFPLTNTVIKDLHTLSVASEFQKALFEKNEQKKNVLKESFKKEPSSEQAFAHFLASGLQREDTLYLGNSLPIRHFSLNCSIQAENVFANRGANGIDGQLSTFFGVTKNEGVNVGVFGDLTLMYDLTAPWALSYVSKKCLIVIINNRGGQIFRGLFKNPIHLNAHATEFSGFAKMWKMDYKKVFSWDDALFKIDHPTVVEFIPNQEQTDKVWQLLKET